MNGLNLSIPVRLSGSFFHRHLVVPIMKAQAFWLLLLGTSVSGADLDAVERNWPAWRGPLANGTAPHGNPPAEWSETRNLKWKIPVQGRGLSTPIIWEDRLFLHTAIPTGKTNSASPGAGTGSGGLRAPAPVEEYQFVLLCLERKTGRTLWQKTLRQEVPHEGHHQADGTFASASPVTDGRRVYAYFGSRGLHCLDFDGNVKWSKDLGRMRIKNAFGEGSSPALAGDALVVNWDHEGDDFIVALDKETGKELWRQSRQEDTSWATPLVVSYNHQSQVIISATRKIRSYDLATGKLLWECGGMTQNVIPSPVTGGGLLHVLSGFRGSALLAIRLGRTGDLTGTDAIAWSLKKNTPYVPSPLLSGNRLYFFSGNNAILSCYEASTGHPLIDAQKIDALKGVYASPVGARGKVYLVGRNGTTVVIKDSDPFEILSTNILEDNIDASPAIVGNELYLRSHRFLYCLSE
ncbi:MAG TPA: PQQ-like beta-propeller repeat protein [Candidatus Paceibacterota bacterium]|nr:PQQ-like beta-propeller repeat protein [Verrucomicrobiota bacterium]HRY48393.1 PQQ-like beta-propeller repeat protein [Candidatus Paceibacterota bacterium]HSA03853.1 PQQ-like beta-propeller repeat protein [Candidatus Paceibacterota bacterium]